jgi:hypothetical protein
VATITALIVCIRFLGLIEDDRVLGLGHLVGDLYAVRAVFQPPYLAAFQVGRQLQEEPKFLRVKSSSLRP